MCHFSKFDQIGEKKWEENVWLENQPNLIYFSFINYVKTKEVMLLGRESLQFLIIQALQCSTCLWTISTTPRKSRDKMPAEDVVPVQISTNICVSVFQSHVHLCNEDFSLL